MHKLLILADLICLTKIPRFSLYPLCFEYNFSCKHVLSAFLGKRIVIRQLNQKPIDIYWFKNCLLNQEGEISSLRVRTSASADQSTELIPVQIDTRFHVA